MSFPWPVIDDDELFLNDALDIAMRYLELPQDERKFASMECFAGEAIMAEWCEGQDRSRQQGHRQQGHRGSRGASSAREQAAPGIVSMRDVSTSGAALECKLRTHL